MFSYLQPEISGEKLPHHIKQNHTNYLANTFCALASLYLERQHRMFFWQRSVHCASNAKFMQSYERR